MFDAIYTHYFGPDESGRGSLIKGWHAGGFADHFCHEVDDAQTVYVNHYLCARAVAARRGPGHLAADRQGWPMVHARTSVLSGPGVAPDNTHGSSMVWVALPPEVKDLFKLLGRFLKDWDDPTSEGTGMDEPADALLNDLIPYLRILKTTRLLEAP